MPQRIVYVVHGGQKFYDQLRYSVLTLLDLLVKQQRNDIEIVVYADRPAEIPRHHLIRAIGLDPKDLLRFRGPLDYIHRVRLEILRRAETEIGLPFIYVDCDTRWTKVPDEQLAMLQDSGRSAGRRPVFFMHENEGEINQHYFSTYRRLLVRKRKELDAWKLQADPPWMMWNAGTIGVPAGSEGVFGRILNVTDSLLLDVRLRNFVDQLVMSVVAASDYELRPFDDALIHYWRYSAELPVVLRKFFDNLPPGLSVEQQASRCGSFPVSGSMLESERVAAANGFAKFRTKMKSSFYKRQIDARVLRLRLNRAWQTRGKA